MTTQHDKEVLDAIFNPFLPLGEPVLEELGNENLEDAEDDDNPQVNTAKQLEKEAVTLAEAENIDEAISLLSEAIKLAPQRPSGYNNRAQAHRLKGNISEATQDLNMAIQLSNGVGRSARQAFCQRGILNRLQGQNDLAKQDFQAAAKLGSKFAKQQLVELNPYAALCNQMLHDVIQKLHTQEM